jgi:hypothetical protein
VVLARRSSDDDDDNPNSYFDASSTQYSSAAMMQSNGDDGADDEPFDYDQSMQQSTPPGASSIYAAAPIASLSEYASTANPGHQYGAFTPTMEQQYQSPVRCYYLYSMPTAVMTVLLMCRMRPIISTRRPETRSCARASTRRSISATTPTTRASSTLPLTTTIFLRPLTLLCRDVTTPTCCSIVLLVKCGSAEISDLSSSAPRNTKKFSKQNESRSFITISSESC